MRKLLSTATAAALILSISLPARAELFKNLKTDGSIEVKAFGVDNATDRNALADDYRSEIRSRVMVGTMFDLLDDVHGRVLLRKNNRAYGQNAESVQNVEDAIVLDNAYAKIDKVFGRVDLTMGRQFYGDPNDINIFYGPLSDDLLSVTAVDMFRADADLGGMAKLSAIGGKTVEGTARPATNPTTSSVNNDQDLFGVDINSEKVIPKGYLSVSYYTLKTKKATAGLNGSANNTLNNLSLKVNGDLVMGLTYNAQLVQNMGRNDGYGTATTAGPANDGTAYLLGVGYANKLNYGKDGMPVRARAEFGRGSDNYQAIGTDKRFGKIWGETTTGPGGAGLTDLKVFDFGGGVTCPTTKIGLDANWYRFMRDAGTVATNGKTSLGSELDLILSYKHSENVSFEASWARFWVGDRLENTAPTGTNAIERLGGDVKIKF